GLEGVDDVEPVETGHLHVEKHDIGPCAPDVVDGCAAVLTFTEDLHGPLALEQRSQPAPRDRLVVDDQGTQRHEGDSSRDGKVRRATAPPPGFPSSENDASAPYNRSSLDRMFLRPKPSRILGGSSGPSLDTWITSRWFSRRASRSTRPSPGFSAMPCRIAFSTSGCRIRLGTID